MQDQILKLVNEINHLAKEMKQSRTMSLQNCPLLLSLGI